MPIIIAAIVGVTVYREKSLIASWAIALSVFFVLDILLVLIISSNFLPFASVTQLLIIIFSLPAGIIISKLPQEYAAWIIACGIGIVSEMLFIFAVWIGALG